MKVSLILTCAGKGERAGFEKNKLLVSIGGKTCLSQSFNAFYKTGLIDEYVITSSKVDYNEISSSFSDRAKIVLGGATRTESVKNALNAVSGDIVLIHDGARPFVRQRIIKDCIENANNFGGTVTAVKSRDTIISGKENIIDYLGKDSLYLVQTPQAFRTQEIIKAYALAGDKVFNDDGEVYKQFIGDVKITDGDYNNIKITYKEDLELLNDAKNIRFGVGFDCHRLVENRDLILGGVKIPHDKGLLGHSDADALTHAVMDAILSSLAMRDIGYHFPDSDPKYKNADSIKLLQKVLQMIEQKGYKIKSLSAVIMAEKPKLLKFIPDITKNLASVCKLSIENVGIGATTLEGLGFVGREEGICVHANAVLENL